MARLDTSGFSQIDREELDHEQIICCPSRSTCKAIILQPDDGVGFAVVFGDAARRSKASWKMSIAHGASEYLGTRPFGTKVASLAIVSATVMGVSRAWLGLRTVIPWAMPLVCLRFRPSTRLARAVTGREAFR
jgi:hypothetical protein